MTLLMFGNASLRKTVSRKTNTNHRLIVIKYESGERRLDVIKLEHVAEALGVNSARVLERV